MSEAERRIDPRIPERVRVVFRAIGDDAEGGRAIEAETLNMSASGLCLVAPTALTADSHLAIELSLEGYETAVMAIGRVVWCDREGDHFRVGVCFAWLREADRAPLQVIADYVKDRTGS